MCIRDRYYTVIDGTAYKYIQSPPCAASSGVVSWNSQFFRPYVDVSSGNAALTVFFSQLKDASGAGVSYEDISERITSEETERLEDALSRAAKFTNFEIGSYSTITDYNLGLTRRDTDDKFYLITNLYDLGDEIYYARFSTDKSFYNYALLRLSLIHIYLLKRLVFIQLMQSAELALVFHSAGCDYSYIVRHLVYFRQQMT